MNDIITVIGGSFINQKTGAHCILIMKHATKYIQVFF